MERKSVKLYNVVVLPFWILAVLPLYCVVTIPLKLVLITLVLRHILYKYQIPDAAIQCRRLRWRIFWLGALADLFGGLLMFLPQVLPYSLFFADTEQIMFDFILPVLYNPFESLPALLWVLGTMVLTSALIYWLNHKFTFRHIDAAPTVRKKLALNLAIWTTPILFLIPSEWF